MREGHLVETALAERLAVSRTLVRAALKLLASKRIVENRPNQGFFLRKAWNEIENAIVDVPPTKSDDLYRAIVRDRLEGHIPERITQVALIERYRVDRVVLLRLLARMADEGIIVKNKGHGWKFLPTINTKIAVRSSYDFRRVVEPNGMLLPTFRVDPAALRRLRDAHLALIDHSETITEVRLYEMDADFHETIASFTRNSFFVQAVQQHNRLRRLLEYTSHSNRNRVNAWLLEHLAIIDALKANKIERAAQRMASHLSKAYRATSLRHDASPRRAACPSRG